MPKENQLIVTIEMNPEMRVILVGLCEFYKMDNRQVIELALEHLACDAKLMNETINAKIKKEVKQHDKD